MRSRIPSTPPSHDIDKEYVSWSIIPNPPSQTESAAGTFSGVDMKLIHHWSTSTCRSIFIVRSPESDFILQQQMPDLAFRTEFLMHGLLGVASLHIQQMTPDPKQFQKQTYIYRARAIRTFRQALDHVGPDADNYDAILLMSLLLVVLCSQDYVTGDDDSTVLHWLSLYRGLHTILHMKYDSRVDGRQISPLLCRKIIELTTPPTIPTVLISMVRLIDHTDPDYEGLESYCQILDALGELYASLAQNGLGDDLYIRAITFCSHPSDEFVMFAKQKRPRALVILMYYLSFLKLVSGIWWVRGISDRDMSIIARTIDPKWFAFMEIPLRIRKTTDAKEITALLLKTEPQ